MHRSELPSASDAAKPSYTPLSDEAIYDLAARVRAAMRRPTASLSADDILSRQSELPTEDEDRLIVALAVLHLLETPPGS
jgi:hypothetical protein